MNQKTYVALCALAVIGAATGADVKAPVLTGATDRDPLGYKAGETMSFTLAAKGGKSVRWTRTGDDGRTEKGEASADKPVVVKTSLDRPGFVRIVAELLDASGKAVASFDGGAGAEVDGIRPDNPAPEDFDAFWARHKAALAKVAMDGAICREVASGRSDVKLYEVSIPCAGPRPSTGFLSVPAKPGKYPARIHFHGYNASWMAQARATPAPGSLRADCLALSLSAHGYEFNREESYYKALRASCGSNGHDYAFDPVQNSDPEQAYFCGMTYRVMRGLEYLKSRPEWDGKTLVAEGGSQGGLQSIWAAALDHDVTECRPFIPWNCNMGGPAAGRAHGDWHIPWVSALGYYDAANMARMIPPTCRVTVTWAGLGDYICPPSGVMAFYNALACPKSIKFVQGATHFTCPPMVASVVSFKTSVQPVAGDATAALQKAFDDCFRAGGGTVTVESGEYAVKGLRLRSNTTLVLKSGAVLKATRNCDDYDILAGDKVEPVPAEDFAPGVVWVTPRKRKTNDHLLKCASRWNNGIIRILRARNVRIVGESGSVIDGYDSYDPIGEEHFRGVHGISVHESTNCVFSGYTIRNTGNWAHNVWRSADLRFENLTILGGHDGVHFSTCDRVAILSCTMKTGDDCVAGFDNDDVTVRGCSFNTACSAFRFGGCRALVEDCRAWGPAEYPIRNSLPKADRISGSHGKPGAGWRTLLSLFTYYSDFTIKVRHDPGEITVRNCRVENAQRFLHYNFSGNETWQKNRPLRSIRFENVTATGLGMSLCAYGDKEAPLSLLLEGCRISFGKTQRELIRAAHVQSLVLKDVSVKGVEGPCVRSWGGVAAPDAKNLVGVEPTVVDADVPFCVKPI